MSTRRAFITQSAAMVAASSLVRAAKLTERNLGVQLYTVRNILGQNPAKVLKDISDIGYTQLEGTLDAVRVAWSEIQHLGLPMVSLHMNLDPTDEQLDAAKKQGVMYAVIPYVPPAKRGGPDVIKRLADSFQAAGQRAKKHGLQLCYHNHAFEFQPMGNTRPIDIILDNTDPHLVQLEMDIFWVTVAGNDPVSLLKKHSGRVPLLHLKDKAKGVPASTQYNENVPKDAFKEVGNGSIDIPAVLKAADAAGVAYYFVEQDQSPDPIASLRQSFAYLKKYF